MLMIDDAAVSPLLLVPMCIFRLWLISLIHPGGRVKMKCKAIRCGLSGVDKCDKLNFWVRLPLVTVRGRRFLFNLGLVAVCAQGYFTSLENE